MKGTGKRLAGPGLSLVEVVDGNDVPHAALVIDPAHRDHPSLHSDLEFGLGFMESPEVTGLVRLVSHSPDEGAFVYGTGTVWSVAELVRAYASMGEVCGVKAGLELCYMAGEILVEAADQSAHSGLEGHGSVDPWKLVLKADGQVSLVGFGLPRPEIEAFLDDETRMPGEDSLRYCAPENLAEEPHGDLGSDLFSLSLVALELMVGRPVYDGLVGDVKQQATRGEAARKLYQWRDRLPTAVREVLGRALKPDPDTRYRDGLDYVYGVHDLLGGIDAGDGPSLREVVARVRAHTSRGSAIEPGRTGSLTTAELAELTADLQNEGAETALRAPRRPRPTRGEADQQEKPRWQRVTRNRSGDAPRSPRRGRRAPPVEPVEKADPVVEDSARDRLLRRLRDRGGERARPAEKASPPKRTAEEPAPPPERKGRRRRPGGRAAALLERLRSSSGETIPPVAPADREPTVAVVPPVAGDSPPVREPTRSPAPPPPREPSPRPDPAAEAPRTQRRPSAGRRQRPVEEAEKDTVLSTAATQVAPPPTSERTAVVRFQERSLTLPAARASELVREATRQLGLHTFDLLGQRVARYRLLAGDRTVDDASMVEGTVSLERIDNRPIVVTVVGADVTARVAVGSAQCVDDLLPGLGALVGVERPAGLIAEGGGPLAADALLTAGARYEVQR
jgi:hypothetical protein